MTSFSLTEQSINFYTAINLFINHYLLKINYNSNFQQEIEVHLAKRAKMREERDKKKTKTTGHK